MGWQGYWKRPVALCSWQRWKRGQDYIQEYRIDWVQEIQQFSMSLNVDSGAPTKQTKHQPQEVEIVGLGPTWVPTEPGCSTFLLSQNTVFLSGTWKCLWLQTLCWICRQERVFLGWAGRAFWRWDKAKDSTEKTICAVCPYLPRRPGPELQPDPVSLFTPCWPRPFISESYCV